MPSLEPIYLLPYTYNGILFSLKKERNSDTWTNLEDIVLSEISRSQKDKYCRILPTEAPRVVKFTETESKKLVARSWREGQCLVFNGYRTSVGENEKVLGMDGGNGW